MYTLLRSINHILAKYECGLARVWSSAPTRSHKATPTVDRRRKKASQQESSAKRPRVLNRATSNSRSKATTPAPIQHTSPWDTMSDGTKMHESATIASRK